MPHSSPQDSDRVRPSVPPPSNPTAPAKKFSDLAEAAETDSGENSEVVIPSAAPVHRQYLDRTTTTSVITLGYRPTKAMARRVYWLGLGLAVVTIISTLPALSFLPFSTAPTWARMVLLISTIQLAYVAWMCLVPDWSTVRITMLVFVGVAAAYGFALAIAIATPPGTSMMFEMGPVRTLAIRWCAVVMCLLAVSTFFSGRLAFHWRKGYVAANGE
jgi:hypothetical protein